MSYKRSLVVSFIRSSMKSAILSNLKKRKLGMYQNNWTFKDEALIKDQKLQVTLRRLHSQKSHILRQVIHQLTNEGRNIWLETLLLFIRYEKVVHCCGSELAGQIPFLIVNEW